MQEIWKAAGAAAWGAVSYGGLLPVLSAAAQEKIETLCEKPAGVFVAAFSYYAGQAPGNLALYCRGEDYHRVLMRRLEQACVALRARYAGYHFIPGADNSPIPEQTTATLAGLGRKGLHNLLIVPPYGSYLVLGTILTDLPLETCSSERGEGACTNCGACRRACPTGALTKGSFDASRCLSQLSQKRGVLTDWEMQVLKKSPLIWGCDLCQRACPCNQKALETSLPEFREGRLHSLSWQDLEGLTNREFQEAFGDRAFAWRGHAVLRRNLALHKE